MYNIYIIKGTNLRKMKSFIKKQGKGVMKQIILINITNQVAIFYKLMNFEQ